MIKSPKGGGLEETKRLMSALLGMKPKPHEDMKLGRKRKGKKKAIFSKQK